MSLAYLMKSTWNHFQTFFFFIEIGKVRPICSLVAQMAIDRIICESCMFKTYGLFAMSKPSGLNCLVMAQKPIFVLILIPWPNKLDCHRSAFVSEQQQTEIMEASIKIQMPMFNINHNSWFASQTNPKLLRVFLFDSI